MISELQDMINVADHTGNQKAKEILLKIAKAPESKQKDLLTLVKILIEPDKAGEILDKYEEEKKA